MIGIARLITVTIILSGIFCVVSVSAQESVPGEGKVAEHVAIDSADLEAFLDGVIEARMKSFHVAGVTVSVVHNGEMIHSKGYGYADMANRTPVDPAATLFRPGSISKTFTWTAVMQLVEKGKLDLDEDIRTYLEDFELPDTYPEPITLSHLMAHTPGFEDAIFGHIFGNDPDAVRQLNEYLHEFQPDRVREPGKIMAYSNYGCALAGHIVSVVSGMPFEDYVERNIFEPLGMNDSTFREPWKNLDMEPMPERLLKQSSIAYSWEKGWYEPKSFEFIHHQGPAGALSSTAADMARWMLAHLGEGSLDGVQILSSETARRMHARHFSQGEEFDGFAHGFVEGRVGPYRTIGHSGGSLYFMSQMVMVPELGFGLFASSNTTGGMSVVGDLPELVVKRFFPTGDSPSGLKPPEDFAKRGRKYVGAYLNPRRSYTQIEKMYGLIAGAVRVSMTKDGYLLTSTIGGNVARWVETAPLNFRAFDSEAKLQFVEDEQGRIAGVIANGQYMHRAGFFESLSAIIGITVLALIVCLGILIAAWYRRHREIRQTNGEWFANLVLTVTAVVWLLFFAAFGLALAGMRGPESIIFSFPPGTLVFALVIALAGVILTLLSIVLLYPVWAKRNWKWGRLIRHTAAIVVLAVLALMLNSLNMIGFKYF